MAKQLKIDSIKKVSDFVKSEVDGKDGPQGLPGIEGGHGPVGPQGPRGSKGDMGATGPQGDRGSTGHTGSQGSTGVQGPQGDRGPVPKHQTRGDAIRFEMNEGEYGKWINLNPGQPHAPIGGGGISEARVLTLIESLNMSTEYNVVIETVGTLKYIGSALPGIAESATGWRIKRLDITTDDIPIFWANGSADFDKIMDDFATYTYTATG
jgi:hypothetical protein